MGIDYTDLYLLLKVPHGYAYYMAGDFFRHQWGAQWDKQKTGGRIGEDGTRLIWCFTKQFRKEENNLSAKMGNIRAIQVWWNIIAYWFLSCRFSRPEFIGFGLSWGEFEENSDFERGMVMSLPECTSVPGPRIVTWIQGGSLRNQQTSVLGNFSQIRLTGWLLSQSCRYHSYKSKN